ncbi:hypothetical protein [Dactylosporangium sp. CA-233914]|uniref:hypothetical protein n=1 Tax=Dactylosporangium sp. CA-233914 TaxID=3239934 RepID=UPI003D8D5031
MTCVLFGLLPLTLADELPGPGPLAGALLLAESTFWGLRFVAQFVAFPAAT